MPAKSLAQTLAKKRSASVPLAALPLVSAALALGACGGSKLDGSLYEGLHTVIDPDTIAPTGTAAVRCSVDRGGDWLAPGDFTARMEAVTGREGGAALAGQHPALTVSGTGAGTYRVFCEIPKYGATDPDGALLTIKAGPTLKTRPVFGKNPIQAGTTTSVQCVGVDAWDNETPLADAQFSTPADVTIAGGQITSTVAGTYPITCGLGDTPRESKDFTVIPGDLVRVELVANPSRAGYQPNASITLDWTAYDAYGNGVEDLPGTLTAPVNPVGVVAVDAAIYKYRLTQEGIFRFSVVLDAPWANLRDDLDVLVDGTAPVIEITYPPRGATIDVADNGGGPVVVTGRIIDQGGVEALSINGRQVQVDASGRFSQSVESRWGVNYLTIVAADKAENTTRTSPSYGYSDGWTSFENADARGLQMPDGLVVLLGQDFFDDGTHTLPIDDIATLLETVLKSLDIRTPITQALSGANQVIPLVNQTQRVDIIPNVSWADLTYVGNLTITLEAAQTTGVGPTRVDIDSRTGGLDFDMVIGTETVPAFGIDLTFDVTLRFDVQTQLCSFLGCIAAPTGTALGQVLVTSHLALGDLDIHIKTDIDKDYRQPMHIEMTELTSTIGDFQLEPIRDVVLNVSVSGIQGVQPFNFSLPLSDFIDLGALFGGLLNPIGNAIGSVLPQLINPVVQSLVGPVLAGVFDLFVLDTSIPIPNLLGGAPVDLDFSTELSTVDFTDDGGTIGLATGIYTEKGIDLPSLGKPGDPHEENPNGAIVRGDCLGLSTAELAWGWNPSVGFGVRTDVINAGFFAAWWSGGLNAPLDLSALGGGGIPIPIDGLAIDMEWLLPPMLNDCSKSGLEVQVGDLYVHLTGEALGFPVEVEMYVDMAIGVGFVSHDGADGGARGLSLRFGNIVNSDIEIASLNDGGLGELFDLAAILQALPTLLGSFITGQEFGPFELPATDLSTIVPTLPAGTTFGLGNLSVTSQSGYAVIGGDLGP
ncbi:MAG: hypothetical protein JNJ59_20250 [Deltaproteobacteria bacterium]|nr:hypothetical protein [Deltaproteobacteria bacterium]